jgi:hypothetical protein
LAWGNDPDRWAVWRAGLDPETVDAIDLEKHPETLPEIARGMRLHSSDPGETLESSDADSKKAQEDNPYAPPKAELQPFRVLPPVSLFRVRLRRFTAGFALGLAVSLFLVNPMTSVPISGGFIFVFSMATMAGLLGYLLPA